MSNKIIDLVVKEWISHYISGVSCKQFYVSNISILELCYYWMSLLTYHALHSISIFSCLHSLVMHLIQAHLKLING